MGSTNYILALNEVSLAEAGLIGQKAARLAALSRAGFPVPQGLVLTTAALDCFRQANAAQSESFGMWASGEWPAELEAALRQALKSLGLVALAVRTSAQDEDLDQSSQAGQYLTILDVQGYAQLEKAVRQCWAEAQLLATPFSYKKVAVIIQRLVEAEAAGVAFSANPLTGEPGQIFISAVQGLGDKLVAGLTTPEEWGWRAGQVSFSRNKVGVLNSDKVKAIAGLTQRVEDFFGRPQDLEWAIQSETIYLLQARPIVTRPKTEAEQVKWEIPYPGGWARNFRLGEWLSEPVTPLFESWLLERLEEGLERGNARYAGLAPTKPRHVLLNGWYFYSVNFFPVTPYQKFVTLFGYTLPAFFRNPYRFFVCVISILTTRFGTEPFVRQFYRKNLPAYRALVEASETQLDKLDRDEIEAVADEIGRAAGDYFWLLVMGGGFAWKAETALADFYKKHIALLTGSSYLPLLAGLYQPPVAPISHGIYNLDWYWPAAGEQAAPANATTRPDNPGANFLKLAQKREAAERLARQTLAGQPRLLKEFERHLRLAQRYVVIREEQTQHFTLGWPLLRKVVIRLGEELQKLDIIERPQDIFWLTKAEVDQAFTGKPSHNLDKKVGERQASWKKQRHLSPPLFVGELEGVLKKIFFDSPEKFRQKLTANKANTRLQGLPASPGLGRGRARVVHSPPELAFLEAGEVLVIGAATPALAPWLKQAAGLVTDVGSPLAHSSLLAREFGVPAVVATGRATRHLQTGQWVTVDGTTGEVY